ncbi:MAG TPA: HNH endonuclease [Nitrospiraceae bacterium]
MRNYAQEVKTAKKRGENVGNKLRHRARRLMLKKGLVKPGQDVDHTKALDMGGSNTPGNLRAASPHDNRSFPRTKTGSMKNNS